MEFTVNEVNPRQLSIWDYLRMDTAEREEEAGVGYSQKMKETDSPYRTEQETMLEKILEPENFALAPKRAKTNKGFKWSK